MSENVNENKPQESNTVRAVADFITSKYSKMNEAEGVAVEMDAEGKSSFDAEGKGPMLPDPINADSNKNKSTLSPKKAEASSSDAEEDDVDETRKEHLEVLFAGEELSEEFKEKAGTIFEAVISERVSEIENAILENYEKQLTENTETILNDLSEKLDDYLNYVVEEWLKENELVVENGIRSDVTENFILGMRTLFEENYIDVPSEKYDLLDGLFEQNELLETSLNEHMHTNKELINELNRLAKVEVFAEVADGLASTDVERLATLTESISDETDIDDFKSKITTLRESYFSGEEIPLPSGTVVEELNEESTDSRISGGSQPSAMDKYVNTIGRHSKANKVS
jgi:hypothetical protein